MKIYFHLDVWNRPTITYLFDDKVFDCGPFTIMWRPKPPALITRHAWRAFGYHGSGTVYSPTVMNEQEALAWVATFGNVAYVDREAGFIFYRPKE
jgi:hypothetical protein